MSVERLPLVLKEKEYRNKLIEDKLDSISRVGSEYRVANRPQKTDELKKLRSRFDYRAR